MKIALVCSSGGHLAGGIWPSSTAWNRGGGTTTASG